MFFEYLYTIVPIFSLILNIFIQVIYFRCLPKLGLLKSEYLGFFIGLFAFLLLKGYLFFNMAAPIKDILVIFIANLIIYLALSYCYFHFVNLGETARRIRILRELYDSKEGFSADEILKYYNSKVIIEKRIDRLVNNGQILFREGRYYIGIPIVLWMAKIILLMRLIVFGKREY